MRVFRTGFPAKDDGKTSRLSFDAIYHPIPLPDRSGKVIPSFHRIRAGLAMCHPALNMSKGTRMPHALLMDMAGELLSTRS